MSNYSKVWIIDDSEMDNFLNKMVLQTIHFAENIDCFCNPVTALANLKQLKAANTVKNVPDVIFLDINMPLMSGFDFLDEFENQFKDIYSNVRFYMISSSEDPEDVEKIKKYPQIIKYLNKPLDKNQLI